MKVSNIQHLATPIHAQLSEPRSAVELKWSGVEEACYSRPLPDAMIFSCERCGGQFEVNDAEVASSGVLVECPSCGHRTQARALKLTGVRKGQPSSFSDDEVTDLPAPRSFFDEPMPAAPMPAICPTFPPA